MMGFLGSYQDTPHPWSGRLFVQDGLLRTRGEYAIAHKLLDEVRLGWVGGGPKIHRALIQGLLLVLDPIQKHLYTCIICIWYLEWILDSRQFFPKYLHSRE